VVTVLQYYSHTVHKKGQGTENKILLNNSPKAILIHTCDVTQFEVRGCGRCDARTSTRRPLLVRVRPASAVDSGPDLGHRRLFRK
jgi:hypothetical protein